METQDPAQGSHAAVGERRGFIRHPASIPIEIMAACDAAPATRRLRDVGHGGLSFKASRGLEPGEMIEVRIAVSNPPTELAAQVVWCQPTHDGYDVGVQFLGGDDAFRARMVEQVCHIRHYRRQVWLDERRLLSNREAALEWISKHAAAFPGSSAAS